MSSFRSRSQFGWPVEGVGRRPIASMSTGAKPTFDKNILRASYFLDLHDQVQPGVGPPKKPLRELPRGAVVFAVGAVDAYLSEVSAEVMLHQLQGDLATSDARETLRRVQQDIPTLSLEVVVLSSHSDRVQRLRDAIVDHLQNRVSHHGSKGVAMALQRMAVKPADLWSALGSQGYPDAASELDYWTDIRHQIVHQGKSPNVRKKRARKFIALAKVLVERIDSIAEEAMSAA